MRVLIRVLILLELLVSGTQIKKIGSHDRRFKGGNGRKELTYES